MSICRRFRWAPSRATKSADGGPRAPAALRETAHRHRDARGERLPSPRRVGGKGSELPHRRLLSDCLDSQDAATPTMRSGSHPRRRRCSIGRVVTLEGGEQMRQRCPRRGVRDFAAAVRTRVAVAASLPGFPRRAGPRRRARGGSGRRASGCRASAPRWSARAAPTPPSGSRWPRARASPPCGGARAKVFGGFASSEAA